MVLTSDIYDNGIRIRRVIKMVKRVNAKEGDYGTVYYFVIEDVDYSGYTAKIYIWKGAVKIVNGVTCSNSYADDDTTVGYTVEDGNTDAPGVYHAEVVFTGANFQETTETFQFRIIEGAE
jgi:hypothetical protein